MCVVLILDLLILLFCGVLVLSNNTLDSFELLNEFLILLLDELSCLGFRSSLPFISLCHSEFFVAINGLLV